MFSNFLRVVAVHHALHGFDVEEPINDDEDGFNLAPEPAEWFFPFMEEYANSYYDEWASVFDNC